MIRKYILNLFTFLSISWALLLNSPDGVGGGENTEANTHWSTHSVHIATFSAELFCSPISRVFVFLDFFMFSKLWRCTSRMKGILYFVITMLFFVCHSDAGGRQNQVLAPIYPFTSDYNSEMTARQRYSATFDQTTCGSARGSFLTLSQGDLSYYTDSRAPIQRQERQIVLSERHSFHF